MKQTTTRTDSPDEVLTLLADQHRRSIIAYFRESSTDDATLTDIATYICEHSDEHVEQVTIELHHTKLPRLADASVVEYDPRSRAVRYQGADDIEHLMDCLEKL